MQYHHLTAAVLRVVELLQTEAHRDIQSYILENHGKHTAAGPDIEAS